MSVTITVRNVWSRISGLKDIYLSDALDKSMSYYVEGYQYTKAFREGYYDKNVGRFIHWDGKKHLLTQRMVFPTGLLKRVTDFFDFHKIEYVIDDKREDVKFGKEVKIKKYTPRQYQIDAVKAAIDNGRGIIRIGTGGGKSLRLGTKVIKYNGLICKVEDLVPGDLLMGPDSQPRKVLSTNIQYGNINKIIPKRGDCWYCNDIHILTLKHTVTNEIIDISIPEYEKQNSKFKHCYKQFSVGVDFPNPVDLPIDPYFLGVWFGDGDKLVVREKLSRIIITTADVEIANMIKNISKLYNKRFVKRDSQSKASRISISGFKAKEDSLLNNMRDLLGSKLKVPHAYLTSTRKNRLEFLAGWIDSDGYLHNNCYEIVQKRKDWVDSIAFLARSLGFKVIIGIKHNKKYNKDYYRIFISGHINLIPVKIPRKKANPRRQKKDPCKTGFKITPAGQDYYVGIELDRDGRFLLEDFTVTHNTLVASMICAKYNLPSMVYVVGKDLLYQFHAEMEKSLGMKIGIIGDGLCYIRNINVCSVWTAITAFNLKSKVSLDDEDWSPEIVSVDKKEKEKIRKIIEKTNVSIYDEAHFLATDTLQSIFKASKKCKFHFGLSGTDWRDDGADLLLESVCGKRIFNMSSSKLISDNYLVKPKIVLFEVPPLTNLPNHYPTVYSKYITKNNVRNGMIEDAARKLIKRGRKVLILVRYISHGKELASRLSDLSIYFVNGEVDGPTRKEVRNTFERGELDCLIASSVFDIGVDIPSLDALILGGGGKSSVRALQRIGRVIRKFDGKNNSIVVDFIDNAKYLIKHSAFRIAVYETESKFLIKFPNGFDSTSIKRPTKVKKKIMN
jgi:superfamily II DNA or RNA helicase